MTNDWLTWANGVLAGIGAPSTPQNLSVLWAWSTFESGTGAQMRWNNPLNTTQNAPGAVSQNGVGVKSYPDVQTGVNATVQTLQNGYYPNILANLKASADPSTWLNNAAHDLGTWGSGVSWLHSIGGVGSATSPTPGASGSATNQPVSLTSLNPLDPVVAFFKSIGRRMAYFAIGFLIIGAALFIMFSPGIISGAKQASKVAIVAGV